MANKSLDAFSQITLLNVFGFIGRGSVKLEAWWWCSSVLTGFVFLWYWLSFWPMEEIFISYHHWVSGVLHLFSSLTLPPPPPFSPHTHTHISINACLSRLLVHDNKTSCVVLDQVAEKWLNNFLVYQLLLLKKEDLIITFFSKGSCGEFLSALLIHLLYLGNSICAVRFVYFY